MMSFNNEDDEEQDENCNTSTEIVSKAGDGGIEGDKGEVLPGQLDGDLPPHLQMQKDQIARRVDWGAKEGSRESLYHDEEERILSNNGEGELNNSLDEMVKFEVDIGETTVKELDLELPKEDTSERKESAQIGLNKVSPAAAAILEAVVDKKLNKNCGCSEPFLEDEERCQENCVNRRARRECDCVPPCSNMAVQMRRMNETAPLVKEEGSLLLSTSSIEDKALLGELTGEVLTKEEVASRLKEYKEAGLYSRIWRLGPDLRMDTAPLQKPGSSFR